MFDTTLEEESLIKQNIRDQGGWFGGACAFGVGNVLRGVGPFADIGIIVTPTGGKAEMDDLLIQGKGQRQGAQDYLNENYYDSAGRQILPISPAP